MLSVQLFYTSKVVKYKIWSDGPDKPKQIYTLRRTEMENQLNQFGNGC